MLKKLSTLITLPVFLAAAGSAFADQEEPSMMKASSTHTISNQEPVHSSHVMGHTEPTTYRDSTMPQPRRYVPPPEFRFIVGGQLGYAYLNSDNYAGYTNDDSGNIFGGVFVGGDYMWNEYVATGLQLGYYYGPDLFVYQGNGGNGDIKVKRTTVIPLLATAKVYLPMNFNVFLKGGIAYVNQRIGDSTHNTYNGALGGGVGYNWNNWEFFGEYMHIFGDENALGSTSSTLPINAFTLGVSYLFPL